MAPAPQRKTKRRRSRASHPVTKQEMRENNPEIVDTFNKKMAPYYKAAGGVAAFITFAFLFIQVWESFGGKTLVSDRALDHAITDVKKEVGTKIEATKTEVVTNQNTIKGEINGNLSKLTETLGSISKSQSASAMDQAEMAMKLAFTQLQSLQSQMATWKQTLVKNPNDSNAQTRVMQLETFIRQNEQDMKDAKDKMTKLRQGVN